MTKPFLTVVIPLFNKPLSVSRALRSVFNQSFSNFELIVVDDGSTDSSLEYVKQFTDTRLRVVSQTNQGVSSARNTGVKLAKADYIAFLDADDCYAPDFLQHISNLICVNPQAALYCCRLQFVNENHRAFKPKSYLSPNFHGKIDNFFKVFSKDRAIIHPSSMAVTKAQFLQVGGFPEAKHVGEDLQLILSLALSGEVMHDSYCGATVFRNAENRTKDRKPHERSCHINYFLNTAKWQQDIAKDRIIAVQHFCCNNAVLHAAGAVLNGQRALAFEYSRIVWRYSARQALLIGALMCCPALILRLAKKFRNLDVSNE